MLRVILRRDGFLVFCHLFNRYHKHKSWIALFNETILSRLSLILARKSFLISTESVLITLVCNSLSFRFEAFCFSLAQLLVYVLLPASVSFSRREVAFFSHHKSSSYTAVDNKRYSSKSINQRFFFCIIVKPTPSSNMDPCLHPS